MKGKEHCFPGWRYCPWRELVRVADKLDISVDARIVGEGEAGIVFDYHSPYRYKALIFNADRSRWQLYEYGYSGRKEHQLISSDSFAPNLEPGNNYTIHLSIDGGEITLTVDQIETFTAHFGEESLIDGSIGLIVEYGKVFFDNFKLDEQIAPTGQVDPSYDLRYLPQVSDQDEAYFVFSDSRFVLNGTKESRLTTALLPKPPNFPTSFDMAVTIQTVEDPGSWQNGFILFDYKNSSDFKYAGMFTGQNQWVIGHYQGGFGNRELTVDWDDQGRQINTDESYIVHLEIQGGQVTMRVNTELIGTATFDVPIHQGQLGMGSYNAHAKFGSMLISRDVTYGNIATLPHYDDATYLYLLNKPTVRYGLDGIYSSINSTLHSNLGAVILPTEGPLPTQVHAAVVFSSNRDSTLLEKNGFLIFDYKNENDFKYVGALDNEDKWIVGHYQGDFSNRLAEIDWAAEGRVITHKEDYLLEIFTDNAEVEFFVNGELLADVTFPAPVNNGRIAYGAYNTYSYFNEFLVEETPQSSLPVAESLAEDGVDQSPVPMVVTSESDGFSFANSTHQVSIPPDGFTPTSGVGLFELSNRVLGDEYRGLEHFALGDLDGDGDLDIVSGNYSSNIIGGDGYVISIWLNDGKGNYKAGAKLNDEGYIYDFDLTDVNGDGTLDIFVVGESLSIWVNDGSAQFTEEILEPVNFNAELVRHADIDNDGDDDVMLSLYTDGPYTFMMLLNDGAGNYTISDRFYFYGGLVSDYSLGDLNGDGFRDVIVSTKKDFVHPDYYDVYNEVFLNDGTGKFISSKQYRFDTDTTAVDLGDVDGDGDLDAVLALRGQEVDDVTWYSRLLLNDGTGDFTVTDQQLVNNRTSDVSFGDLDADGDLDLVYSFSSTGNTENFNEILLNDGTGLFAPPIYTPGIRSSQHALGDLNGDGSLDIFMNGSNDAVSI
ncbi:MAG: VCBS repeat-containing protein [Planctomycetaceae bacterium]